MIRHIEFTIDFDLTCWGWPEDFQTDDPETIKEAIVSYLTYDSSTLLDYLKLKNVWYEED